MQIEFEAPSVWGCFSQPRLIPSNYRRKEFDVICEHSFRYTGLCQASRAAQFINWDSNKSALPPDVQMTSSEDTQRNPRQTTKWMLNS